MRAVQLPVLDQAEARHLRNPGSASQDPEGDEQDREEGKDLAGAHVRPCAALCSAIPPAEASHLCLRSVESCSVGEQEGSVQAEFTVGLLNALESGVKYGCFRKLPDSAQIEPRGSSSARCLAGSRCPGCVAARQYLAASRGVSCACLNRDSRYRSSRDSSEQSALLSPNSTIFHHAAIHDGDNQIASPCVASNGPSQLAA